MSNHICESELYSVYNEHIKNLQNKLNSQCPFSINSDLSNNLLYQDKNQNNVL